MTQRLETVHAPTVKNFATVIFIDSGAFAISVNATRIIAGGPVGINIIENQSIGSASISLVFDTSAQIRGMLILICVNWRERVARSTKDLQRPDDESEQGDKY